MSALPIPPPSTLPEALPADIPARGFLRHIRACNRHDPAIYRPFFSAETLIGRVRPAIAAWLTAFDSRFEAIAGGVRLSARCATAAERSAALAAAATEMAQQGLIPPLRHELYPVLTCWETPPPLAAVGETPPLAAVDRSAVTILGIPAYGLHVNGYVRHPQHGLSLWVARRALDRAVAPDKLDNMIAGGQPLGLSLAENLRKEAAEEAGLPAEWADQAQPVGALHYVMDIEAGLRDDTLFLYDLELPPDITPHNQDGEVAAFMLWPVAEVARSIHDTESWKFNCPLVVIDFLIRHRVILPDAPDYAALVAGLQRLHA